MFYFWLLLKVISILFVGGVMGSWLAGIVSVALERRGADPAIRRLVSNATQPLLLVIAGIAAAQTVGLDLTAAVAVMGALSLAIGLALKSTLSNVASGGILLTTRPIKEGEFVEVAGQSGTVIEQGLYTTTLRAADGTLTTLPNDLILAAPVHNYSRHGQRRLEIRLIVDHASDLEVALEVMTGVLGADERVLKDPAPSTLSPNATPRGLEIMGRAWVANADFAQTRSDLNRASIAALRSANIHLSARPNPTRTD
jgi:small conductance mechanosensitive channel